MEIDDVPPTQGSQDIRNPLSGFKFEWAWGSVTLPGAGKIGATRETFASAGPLIAP